MAVMASSCRVVVPGVLAVACGDGDVPMGVLLSAALLFGLVEALYLPSSQSMVTTISSEDAIERVQPLFSGMQRLGVAVGPMCGGAMVGSLPPRALFLALAMMSLMSAACLFAVRERRPASPTSGADLGSPSAERASPHAPPTSGANAHPLGVRMPGGVRRMLANDVLRSSLALIVLAEFAASGLTNAGYAMLATARAWDGFQLGQLLACYGVGAAAAACVMAFMFPKRPGLCIGLGIVAAGLGFVATGATGSLVLASLFSVVAGVGSGVASTLLVTRFVTYARSYGIATAVSVMSLASFGAAPLASLYCGCVSWAFSPAVVFASLGAALMVVGTWFSLRNHTE